jgi:aminoglycoside/choline kinase family phosphotransferase
MISQVAGVGADRAEQAVVSLAGLHRELWESPALDGFTWMPNFDDQINLNAGQSYREAWPVFLERVGSALPHGAVAFGERLKESFETVMRQSYAGSPRTVLHGDFRIDNLLFDDRVVPADRVGVLDWQISGRGPGVFDVAYLLAGSMTVEERRTAEVDIVRSWYDALGSPEGYSYDDAWREYRRTSMATTVYGVVSAAQMDPANERGRELVEAMAVRSFIACLDLESVELLA